MSLKTVVTSRIMAHLVGEPRLRATRRRAERRRRRLAAPHLVEYFHQVDDPYSHLAVQALLKIRERYDVTIRPHLVGPPADWAAPERDRLIAYARLDAARLAGRAGLSFADPGQQPAPDRVDAAASVLAARRDSGDFLETATSVGAALWADHRFDRDQTADADVLAAIADGERRREALGHFMSAMIYYAGEWYWGVDRLHYLEDRLCDLGACTADAPAPLWKPAPRWKPTRLWEPSPEGDSPTAAAAAHWVAPTTPAPTTQPLHFYLSFRSPYTAIATDRVKALADAYGAELELRFVLPMVMRGLPVPRMKGLYFARDAAREARRLGVPFGRIADPVGRPVERGYSLLPWARDQGQGYEYCRSFLRATWAEGVDAGSDAGLRRIVEAAGLRWSEARGLIGNDAWRAEAEANRTEMFDLGLWGVPCFRVGDVVTWGQDRLWVVEEELQRQAASNAPRGSLT